MKVCISDPRITKQEQIIMRAVEINQQTGITCSSSKMQAVLFHWTKHCYIDKALRLNAGYLILSEMVFDNKTDCKVFFSHSGDDVNFSYVRDYFKVRFKGLLPARKIEEFRLEWNSDVGTVKWSCQPIGHWGINHWLLLLLPPSVDKVNKTCNSILH